LLSLSAGEGLGDQPLGEAQGVFFQAMAFLFIRFDVFELDDPHGQSPDDIRQLVDVDRFDQPPLHADRQELPSQVEIDPPPVVEGDTISGPNSPMSPCCWKS
jgi:hypothetical protein